MATKWTKYKVKRADYITDNYIKDVEHYLYNDLPIDKFYEDTNISKFNQRVIEGLLKKGEKYTRLKHERDHIVLTSFGRCINTHLVKQFCMRISAHTFHLYVTGKKINLPKIFKQEDWEYDFNVIKNKYIKNKWKYQDTSKYSYYAGKAKEKRTKYK